ncbi:MAG: hypothetical protein ACREE1_16490 [Stellaceae bacterium]
MFKLIRLAASAATLATLMTLIAASATKATVIFDFYETGFTQCVAGSNDNCNLPPTPFSFVLMSLTLSSGNETGSAVYSMAFVHNIHNPPVVTDPEFDFGYEYPYLVAPFYFGEPPICVIDYGDCPFVNYSITWTATNNTLTSLSLFYLDNFIEAGFNHQPFGMTGGWIGSDGVLGGCPPAPQCIVTGYWQDGVLPEPASGALFLGALFGLGCIRWRSRTAAHRRARLPT